MNEQYQRDRQELYVFLEKCFGLDEEGRKRHERLRGLDGLTLEKFFGLSFIAFSCLTALSQSEYCA